MDSDPSLDAAGGGDSSGSRGDSSRLSETDPQVEKDKDDNIVEERDIDEDDDDDDDEEDDNADDGEGDEEDEDGDEGDDAEDDEGDDDDEADDETGKPLSRSASKDDADDDGSEDNERDEDSDADDDDGRELGKKDRKRKKKLSKKSRKKARAGFGVRNLFVEEAEEDDDSESDDDRETGENVTTEHELEAIERQRAGRERMKELFGGDAAAIAQRYDQEEAFLRDEEASYREIGDLYRANTQVAQQSLLPSAKDPPIFMIKCSPGKEQELCRSVMNKTLAFFEKTKLLKIKTAFCGAARGYIFIEALAEAQVKEIIMGLKGIYMGTITRVPVNQMTSTLDVKVKRKPLKVGQFVRIKRGPLKGDVVRIVSLKEGDTKAEVQAVPRIDYYEVQAQERGAVMKLNAGQKVRPPAALFDPERAFALENGGVDRDDRFGFYHWRNNTYKDGFLIKLLDVNAYIDQEGAAPSADEMKQFAIAAQRLPTSGEMDDAEQPLSAQQQSFNEMLNEQLSRLEAVERVPFVVGDLVRVVSGETAGLVARVLGVDDLRHVLRVQPLSAAQSDLVLDIEERWVAKHIEVGVHVKVMTGRFAGHTGRVVAVSLSEADPTAVLVTDGAKREISCNISSLQLSSDVAIGYSDLQGYRLYDLVQVSENEAAVVVQVGQEALRVLNQFDRVSDVDPATIRAKLNVQSSRTMRFDAQNRPFRVGDSVKVLSGDHAKLQGTVKHMHKGFVWLHSDSFMKNSGVFVVKSQACLLTGSAQTRALAQTRVAANQAPKHNQSMSASSTPQSVGAGRGGAQAARGARDPLAGRTVRIIKGMHRGKLAQILGSVSGFYTMELLAQLKKVDLPREHFVMYEDGGSAAPSAGFFGSGASAATAADSFIPPTPHVGLATPMYSGAETPSYLGAQTPRVEQSDAWRVGDFDLHDGGAMSVDMSLSSPARSELSAPSPMYPQQTQSSATMGPPSVAAQTTNADPSTWLENMILVGRAGDLNGRLVVLRSLPDFQGMCRVQQRDGNGRLIFSEVSQPVSSLAPTAMLPKHCVVHFVGGKLKGRSGVVQNQMGKDVVVSVDGATEYVKAALCVCLNPAV